MKTTNKVAIVAASLAATAFLWYAFKKEKKSSTANAGASSGSGGSGGSVSSGGVMPSGVDMAGNPVLVPTGTGINECNNPMSKLTPAYCNQGTNGGIYAGGGGILNHDTEIIMNPPVLGDGSGVKTDDGTVIGYVTTGVKGTANTPPFNPGGATDAFIKMASGSGNNFFRNAAGSGGTGRWVIGSYNAAQGGTYTWPEGNMAAGHFIAGGVNVPAGTLYYPNAQ